MQSPRFLMMAVVAALAPAAVVEQEAPPFVRPWNKPPGKAAPRSREGRRPRGRPGLPHWPREPVRRWIEPVPITITPCTSLPGNPVFTIKGGKVTMTKGQ